MEGWNRRFWFPNHLGLCIVLCHSMMVRRFSARSLSSLCVSMLYACVCLFPLHYTWHRRPGVVPPGSCGFGFVPGERGFHILCLFIPLWATQWMATGTNGQAGAPVPPLAPTAPSSGPGSATGPRTGEQSARGTGSRPETASSGSAQVGECIILERGSSLWTSTKTMPFISPIKAIAE